MVWNPCHDLAAVREWVAEEMGRVMRETGADGIRLDEYGHRGWACYDESHEHTYAEPGITQWQKATSEATRLIHEAMDKVRPDLVLTKPILTLLIALSTNAAPAQPVRSAENWT